MPRARAGRHILTTLVGVALIGLVFLLPDLAADVRTENEAVLAYRGRIESIQEPAAGDPSVPIAKVRMFEGPQADQVIDAYMSGPGGSQSIASYRAGDEVVVTITAQPGGSGRFVAVSDRWRIPQLQVLALLFAAAVVGIGGWHGVRALVALGLTIAVILKILLPLVISGVAPVPLAVIAASGVTVVTIVLTEGWKRSSLAAILGTTGSLAITGLLAASATAVMSFTYVAGSDLAFLATAGGEGLDLRGVLLAAFILGAVGVLDDVTVTQAALVEELADKGGLRGSRLIASGMAIGRSHISATVNTLFLAYVGAGLPLLVVLLVSRQPGALVLNDETIATEIVRTLVGSLGIVAAVPLTTFVAASLIDEPLSGDAGSAVPRPRRRPVMAVGAIVAALLVATAALPLTSGSRPALVPDVFDPGGLASPVTSDRPVSGEPIGSPAAEPVIITAGVPVPIVLDGEAVGTITVSRWTVQPGEGPASDDSISVLVRYEATAPFSLDAGTWELLLADGTEIPLVPIAGGDELAQTLAAGEALELTLQAEYAGGDASAFIVFVDNATSAVVFAVPIE